MTTPEINKRLHMLLDLSGEPPDYCADPRLVIKVMRERKDWEKFITLIGYLCVEKGYGTTIWKEYIRHDLIMDETGALALLALEWLEKEKK